MTKIRIGTRGSKLAMAQTHMTIDALARAYPALQTEIVVIETTGDKTQQANVDLHKIGGKGLFADTLRQNLSSGHVDILVHSMKDLPSIQPSELMIAAMLERGDARDCFLCNIPGVSRIEDLPQGAIVGTSAPRRAALVKKKRPDLQTVTFRGNVPTRIEKLNAKFENVSATFLARIGMDRIGLGDVPRTILDIDTFLPPAGQAAIGIEVLASNKSVAGLIMNINHLPTYRCVMAERACLAVIDGDCKTGISAHATEDGGRMTLRSEIFTADGQETVEVRVEGAVEEYQELGRSAGEYLLAKIPAAEYDRYGILAGGAG